MEVLVWSLFGRNKVLSSVEFASATGSCEIAYQVMPLLTTDKKAKRRIDRIWPRKEGKKSVEMGRTLEGCFLQLWTSQPLNELLM